MPSLIPLGINASGKNATETRIGGDIARAQELIFIIGEQEEHQK
jgi:hypothetical protein